MHQSLLIKETRDKENKESETTSIIVQSRKKRDRGHETIKQKSTNKKKTKINIG